MTENEILFKEIGLKKLFTFRSIHNSVLPLVRGFYVSRCLEALEISGCLDVFRSEGRVKLADFLDNARNSNYNTTTLHSIFDYLYSIGIFSKDGNAYLLTKKGHRICFHRHGFFHFVQAYGSIFSELPEILMGTKVYGKDVHRQDRYVAKATAEVSEWVPLPAVRRIIRKYGFNNVLDLGCGRGELLRSLSTGVISPILRGVDMAVDSVADGMETIKKAGHSNRMELKVADITSPTTFADWLAEAEVVTIMFVLHEFANNGDEFIINFLKQLKSLANKNAYFLIAETPSHDPDRIRKHPTAIAEHHLFHRLSNQGILSIERLRSIVKKAGLSIKEDLHIHNFSQHYILVK